MIHFLKWFIKESTFHITLLFTIYGITLCWEPTPYRLIARVAITFIVAILLIGKYKYWLKIQRYK